MSYKEIPEVTNAWKRYEEYKKYLQSTNILNVLDENRRFYHGDQYDKSLPKSLPKPVMNICLEYVEKVTAKLLQTPWAVEFNCEDDRENLHDLDMFYDYQMLQISDRLFCADIIKTGFIDGIGMSITAYDKDTYGGRGLYRGFLTRKLIPFEDWFFANPYCEDVQSQQYVGYAQRVPIRVLQDMCRNSEEKELIVPDDWDFHSTDYKKEDIGFKTCTLLTRYFRDRDGEVVFELATKYAHLYTKLPYLHAGKNSKAFENETLDPEKTITNTCIDYEDMYSEKNVIQEKPEQETQGGYEKKLNKFHRYPISVFRPYPIRNSVFGYSILSQLITTQKQVNFVNMMSMTDMQNHGFAKFGIFEDSLVPGQTINNDPAQVLIFKRAPGRSIQSEIVRIEPSSMPNEQVGLGAMFISQARSIYSFDNLKSDDGNLNDTSGYALQQIQKQQNLALEIPQQRFWEYIKDNAKTDLLFFRFYVDEAKYYIRRTDGEIENNENYRVMAQNIYNATGATPPGADENGQLAPTTERVAKEIKNDMFQKDYEIAIEVTQGIAGSQIAESQHFAQVMQILGSSNMDASLMKAWIEGDPAFSRKVKSNLKASIDAVENSQLAQKQAEIDQLKQYIQQMSVQMQQFAQQIEYQKAQVKAIKDAASENAKMNQQFVSAAEQNYKTKLASVDTTTGSTVSEGQIKSQNAKGEQGGSFDTL